MQRVRFVVSALLLAAFAPEISAADLPLSVEESALKVEIRGAGYSLRALIVKPVGAAGRLPVAIIAHGSPRDSAARRKYDLHTSLPQARDLAHRGWLTVAFLRRGFGESDGPFAEGYTCPDPDYRKALETAAEDIEAIRAAVAHRPDADSARVLGLGTSVGGASMLAWAAARPEGLVGIVNVSGGTGSPAAGQNCDENALVSAFASFGARSRVPTLWLYAENDTYFGPDLVRRLHAAYTREGGRAMLSMFGPVGADGHQLWYLFDGRMLWLPAMDGFLRAQHLPTWDPRPLEDITSRLDQQQRSVLANYLGAPTEKALAIAPRRRLLWFSAGRDDLEAARQASLEGCERAWFERCEAAAENFGPPNPH